MLGFFSFFYEPFPYDVTVHYKEKTEEINRSMEKLSSLTGAMKIHEVMIGSELLIKKKICHQIHFSRWLKSRRAGGECQLSLLLMWTWNKSLLHILVSSCHQIIITSYLVLLHISKTLIYHCCIATSAKITVGKQFPAKSIRRRKMC